MHEESQRPHYARTRWPLTGPYDDGHWTRRHRLRGDALAAAWARFLGRVAWEVFVTLTFDPKRGFPVDARLASREAFRWCGVAAYVVRRPMAWVFAIEQGRGGAWHVHALIVGAGEPMIAMPAAIWEARNGQAHVRPVHDAAGVALYTSKSVARGGEIVLSDTLVRYQPHLAPGVVVPLWPAA